MDLLKRYIPVLFLLAVVVAIQLVTHFTETSYYLTQLTMSAYYSVVVIGLCVLILWPDFIGARWFFCYWWLSGRGAYNT